jgi:hypothetical protein
MASQQPTPSQGALNTRTAYTITSDIGTFDPPRSCVSDLYMLPPSGYDSLTVHTSLGTILIRGYDAPCYPSEFGPGVVYSPAECPTSYDAVVTSINTYNVFATSLMDDPVSDKYNRPVPSLPLVAAQGESSNSAEVESY